MTDRVIPASAPAGASGDPAIEPSVRILPLGGLGEIGLNMMLLESGEDLLAVDCGLMFPDDLKSDVVIKGEKVVLEFEGKGGKRVKRELRDRLLARVAQRLTTLRVGGSSARPTTMASRGRSRRVRSTPS